jgi:hypothetical protein
MWKIFAFVAAVSGGLSACSSSGGGNTLGGDPNVPIGQIGNVVSAGTVTIGSESADIGLSATVTDNQDGVANVRLVADLSGSPDLPPSTGPVLTSDPDFVSVPLIPSSAREMLAA